MTENNNVVNPMGNLWAVHLAARNGLPATLHPAPTKEEATKTVESIKEGMRKLIKHPEILENALALASVVPWTGDYMEHQLAIKNWVSVDSGGTHG